MRTIVWQRSSRYALVTCINNGRGVVVEKEIAPGVVTEKSAHWVNETSEYFRDRLRSLGVPLAEPYTYDIVDGKAIQSSPYAGLDLDKVFNNGNASLTLVRNLIEAIAGILSQEVPEVGIDARLSNFCLGPGQEVYYVDTFPPLVKYEGELLVHFPNPTDPEILEQEFHRKFDPLGILRRLRFSILAEGTGITEDDILWAVRAVMGEEFTHKVEDLFRNLSDKKKVEQALAELSLDDPDAIRELALRFMPPKGEERRAYFSEIFDLSSHFCPRKELTRDDRLTRIRAMFAENM